MESIEVLNARLIDHFGVDSSTGKAMFRIVWSNDETEKRLMDVTDLGVQLLHPEVREVQKYPFFKNLYILERLVAIPEINQEELPTEKLSYEPIWTYRDENNNPLPPIWSATKFIVDCLYAALGKKSLAKYVDNDTPEVREERITKLTEELFGNETETGDAMSYDEAIVVPNSYKKDN